jgi:UDP-N-acetylmuramate--alanine ligase
VHLVRTLDDLPRAVAALARPNDLVITLGAGSIGAIGDRVLAELGGADRRAGLPTERGGEG